MRVTTIILAHYKQRQDNLKRIIDDLLAGTVKPDEIVVFIDNPDLEFDDDRATIIKSSNSFLPKIRFALGSYFDTDYCFFIDDDLSVRSKTLENFVDYADRYPGAILGLEGSILGDTPHPYGDDTSIQRGNKIIEVDVILRTYFVPSECLSDGLKIQALNKDLPRISLDDVYLCLGNKYLNKGKSFVIPVNDESNLLEIGEHGVGQSMIGLHYENRNEVTRKLMDRYGN